MIGDQASLNIHGDALDIINDSERNHSFHCVASRGTEMAEEEREIQTE